MTWRSIMKQEWTHLFVHSLDTIMKNWYVELEVHRGTGYWEELTKKLRVTLNFQNNDPLVDSTLYVIKNNIFESKYLLNCPSTPPFPFLGFSNSPYRKSQILLAIVFHLQESIPINSLTWREFSLD
jgi:hypothetical protein